MLSEDPDRRPADAGEPCLALYALARPKLLPYVLLLTTAGYGWAHWDRALTMRGGTRVPALFE